MPCFLFLFLLGKKLTEEIKDWIRPISMNEQGGLIWVKIVKSFMYLLMADGIELSDVDGFGVDFDDGVGLVFGIALSAFEYCTEGCMGEQIFDLVGDFW